MAAILWVSGEQQQSKNREFAFELLDLKLANWLQSPIYLENYLKSQNLLDVKFKCSFSSV